MEHLVTIIQALNSAGARPAIAINTTLDSSAFELQLKQQAAVFIRQRESGEPGGISYVSSAGKARRSTSITHLYSIPAATKPKPFVSNTLLWEYP